MTRKNQAVGKTGKTLKKFVNEISGPVFSLPWLVARDEGLFEEEGLASGHFLEVKRYVPQFHGDGRADWDVLVSITYRNWAALAERGPSDLMERLFPDQKRYKEEERHRFAILEAHWDVPLEERPLE